MGSRVFVDGPDVQDGHQTLPQPRGKLVPADSFGKFVAPRQSAQDAFDLRQVAFGNDAHESHQVQRSGVGQPVDDGLAVAAAGDEPRTAQLLQMLRAVGDGESGFC